MASRWGLLVMDITRYLNSTRLSSSLNRGLTAAKSDIITTTFNEPCKLTTVSTTRRNAEESELGLESALDSERPD